MSNVPPLDFQTPIVNPESGTPTLMFREIWQRLFMNGGTLETRVTALENKVDNLALSDLTDVDITTTPPANGDVLTFDSGTNKWVPGTGGGSSSPWYFNPPVIADLTLASGDATNLSLTDDTDVGLLVNGNTPVTGDKTRWAYKTIPSPSADWDVSIHLPLSISSEQFTSGGLIIRSSVSGRLILLGTYSSNGGTNGATGQWGPQRFTGLGGSFSAAIGTLQTQANVERTWYRIKFTAASNTYTFYWSIDGKLWIAYPTTETISAFLTNAADQVGLGVNYNKSGGVPVIGYCDNWTQSW